MSQLFTIENDKIIINKLALRNTEGIVEHTGNLNVNGFARITNDLAVEGSITVDTLNVKNLITETGAPVETGVWTFNQESDLNGKGFSWNSPAGTVNLMYRTGKRLWTNGDIDLDDKNSYKIGNTEVLSLTALGAQVTSSNLKEVGTLRSLSVLGDVSLSQFAIFNGSLNRLGLNTDSPNAVLSVVDNDVELIVGSENFGSGDIGTYSNSNLNIVTDNVPRIVVRNTGEVVFGNETTKTASVTIYGTLKVDTLVADTRIDRYSSLEFKSTKDSSIYGKGLEWAGQDSVRKLVMVSSPDRLFTTESFDIDTDRSYYVGGRAVLSQSALGETVINSKLTTLGVLESLNVEGKTTLSGDVETTANFNAKSLTFTQGATTIKISGTGVDASKEFSIKAGGDETYYADSQEIILGNSANTRRQVKVFGPVAIGINNPDPDVSLAVNGNISFSNKKFVTGTSAPTQGTFAKGDICWNQDPKPGSYIGWVCISSGAPGTWVSFGTIGQQ